MLGKQYGIPVQEQARTGWLKRRGKKSVSVT